LRAILAIGLLLAATRLSAAEEGFIATLSAEQQAAAGLTGLTTAECAALDQLVAADQPDMRLAEGKVLSGTFVSRRTEAERKETGLDRLNAAQLARLDELVANATTLHPKPKDRPRLKEDNVINAKPRTEVHGSVSFTLGKGPGGTFRGTDVWLSYYIPDYGLSLGFGVSQYTGGFLPFGYYPGNYYMNPAARGTLLLDNPDRNFRRENFSSVTGQSFSATLPWASFNYSRSHH
jgi:hypothetical protein